MATSASLPRGSVTPTRPPLNLRASKPPAAAARVFWQPVVRDEEKRQWPRRSLRCALKLINLTRGQVTEPTAVPAECSNISNGGLYAVVPIGYGVAIGQRYNFQLSVGERGPEPGARQMVSQQGEIMRAELLLGEDGYGDRVGVGVRLFGPRSGLVPMPMTA